MRGLMLLAQNVERGVQRVACKGRHAVHKQALLTSMPAIRLYACLPPSHYFARWYANHHYNNAEQKCTGLALLLHILPDTCRISITLGIMIPQVELADLEVRLRQGELALRQGAAMLAGWNSLMNQVRGGRDWIWPQPRGKGGNGTRWREKGAGRALRCWPDGTAS